MQLNEFLEEFQKEYHIDLPKGSYEVPSVVINREISLYFKELVKPTFVMYSVICPLPAHHRDRFFEEVLKANLIQSTHEGVSFGIDEKTQSIVQFYRFNQEPKDYQEIIDKIKGYCAIFNHYKKIFSSL